MTKKMPDWMRQDPNAEREQRKYERPIPSRDYILQSLDKAGKPLRFAAMAKRLKLHDEVDLIALDRRLGAMVRDGQLVLNRRGDYCLIDRLPVVAGRVIAHRDGFGFLKPDDGGDDIFLPPRQMRALMHGDRATVRVQGVDTRGRREGSLVDVLERNTTEVAGRYFEESGIAWVKPDNSRITHDVLIPQESRGEAHHGQIVVAEIVSQPEKRSQPVGRVISVMGEHRAPGMEVELAIHAHSLPHAWPQEVEDEAMSFGIEVNAADKREREDLRELDLVTIDGADARDFDDAVYCEATRSGWRLLVAIADVSHYVRIGSALDQEAEKRGTSVYFPDRVVPMLPEALSNELCSLKPDVDRLCMVCEMRIDRSGKITRARFFEGLMRSSARLTYEEVAEIVVERKAPERKARAALVEPLERLYELYQVLAAARRVRGAIDFESTETRVVFGDDGRVQEIRPLVRNDAHRLIEECMIAANVEAARFLDKNRIPTLYRAHEGPPAEKLQELREFLGSLGLSLGGGMRPSAKEYSQLLERVKVRPDRRLIETVLLRSLSQAVYAPESPGHFGLSLEHYGHFTSPIRRYPDLLVHRAIRHLLRGGKPKNFEYSPSQMETLGLHCSMTERRADEASRDAMDGLKAEFMQDKVGQEFDGIITGVTSFGLFIELDGVYVEGLVHVTSLGNDYYRFDDVHHQLVGDRSGRVYQLGDRIRVSVARVSLDDRKIDFEPVEAAGAERRRGIGRRRRR